MTGSTPPKAPGPDVGEVLERAAVALTLDEIVQIFSAGCQRGSDEATAYDWGSSAPGKREDDLAAALHEIFNAGRLYDAPGYIGYGNLAEVWSAALARASS